MSAQFLPAQAELGRQRNKQNPSQQNQNHHGHPLYSSVRCAPVKPSSTCTVSRRGCCGRCKHRRPRWAGNIRRTLSSLWIHLQREKKHSIDGARRIVTPGSKTFSPPIRTIDAGLPSAGVKVTNTFKAIMSTKLMQMT